jgi:hypothetical protein
MADYPPNLRLHPGMPKRASNCFNAQKKDWHTYISESICFSMLEINAFRQLIG